VHPASRDGVVLVGGGPASWSCAFALRAKGFDGSITLVCREPRAPYDRTMISKDCLLREPADQEFFLSGEAAYEDAGIEVLAGVAARALDIVRREVELEGGERLPYGKLVIATGGRPFVPRALRCDGIHTLRRFEDARALASALASAKRLAIVGGGLIAGEVASAAVRKVADVVMLEALEAPLARVLGEKVGRRVAELHRRAGVDLRVGVTVRRIVRLDRDFVVEMDDGSALSADAVVVATGMAPEVEWLLDTPGLRLDSGVVTDERCRTDVPNVYAAGDCARWWNRSAGRLSRVEHWDTAVRHGQAVAGSILGSEEPFVPVPFNWSIQHGHRLHWVGDTAGWDEVAVDDTGAPEGLVARFSRDDSFCAGFAIDSPRAVAAMRRELTANQTRAMAPG
jgi:3-phenylpropionate/trans-cinnamate dioxygenase ferredoxin reductase component